MIDLGIAFLQLVVEHVPRLVLWLGAFVGHGFLWMISINVFYAFAIPHKLQDFIRKIDFLIILAGPFLLLPVLAWTGQDDISPSQPQFLLVPYVVFCFFVGVIVVPIAQVLYWLRRPAPQIASRTSKVVDMARELGYPPRGTSRSARATRLPGNQVFQVDFVDLHLRMPNIPVAWDGLTILHLTDLHFHAALDRAFYTNVMDRAMQWGVPDLVCLTGDVVDSEWHHRWIPPVLGRLRWKTAGLFILGNHDVWWEPSLIRRRLCRLGMQDVGNAWKKIDVRGEPMAAIGHEGPWIKPIPDLKDCPTDMFRLLLSHSPDSIGWARRNRMDLMLAGHVHGGQIRFPLIGSLFVPSRHSRRFDCGTFYEAPTLMHVGRGLAGKHPLRINCRPEVTRLVLHRG